MFAWMYRLPAVFSAYNRNKERSGGTWFEDLRSEAKGSNQCKGLPAAGLCGRCGFWYPDRKDHGHHCTGAWLYMGLSGPWKRICHSLLRYLPDRGWHYFSGIEGEEGEGVDGPNARCKTGKLWFAGFTAFFYAVPQLYRFPVSQFIAI